MKSDLLLHHCCAPCSVKVIDRVKENFNISGFWFNPNIHPLDENTKRKNSLIELAAGKGVKLYFGQEYTENLWIQNAGKFKDRFCNVAVKRLKLWI